MRAVFTNVAAAVATVAALVLCLGVITPALAKTKYVMNLDIRTFWKIVRPGRLAIVKFDTEHPHGPFQDGFVRLAEEITKSHGTEIFLGEIRLKASDANDGGNSANIPIFEFFNESISRPGGLIALIPKGRVDYSVAHLPAADFADEKEFDVSFDEMGDGRKFHYASVLEAGSFRDQFTAGLGARWVNTVLRRYPMLTDSDKYGMMTEQSKPIARSARGNQTEWGKGFVSFAGVSQEECSALATGPNAWSAMISRLAKEAAEFKAQLEEKVQQEAEAKAAKEAADREAGLEEPQDEVEEYRRAKKYEEEIEHGENTNVGKRMRQEHAAARGGQRDRTWLLDLVRKLVGVKRNAAKPLPTPRHLANEDSMSQLMEVLTDATAPAAKFSSLEQVLEEEAKLRLLARSLKVSRYTRERADQQLSALWCVRRYFRFGDQA